MESITSMERAERIYRKYGFTIDYNMPDYRNAPFFKKKLAQAEANLAQDDMPEDFIEYSRRHAHLRQPRNLTNPNADTIE